MSLRQVRLLGFTLTASPHWLLSYEGFDPALEPARESILAISNGYLGTRAALEEGHPVSYPLTLIAGIFERESHPAGVDELVAAPHWSNLRILIDGRELNLDTCELLEQQRTLDLRQGVLVRQWRLLDQTEHITQLISLRFVSLFDRHALAQRLLIIPENYDGEVQIDLDLDGRTMNARGDSHLKAVLSSPLGDDAGLLVMDTAQKRTRIALAGASKLDPAVPGAQRSVTVGRRHLTESWRWMAQQGQVYRLEKLVSVFTSRDSADPGGMATEHLTALQQRGLQSVLNEHIALWEKRWQTAAITIEGDDLAQLAARYAAHHLISVANPEDERVSVGARGLTGEGYRGHVFWDTEIFTLPFHTLTDPAAAHTLLMYRYHSLPAAQARAHRHGYEGAMFAWESADTGEDVTPSIVIGRGGRPIPVLCGMLEHHIVADIAYAVWQYWLATGDQEFFYGPGAELVLACAQFWASRARREDDGRFHIRGVIGPDEYHENVDNNAFTNWMAAWTLRRGIDVARLLEQNRPDQAPDRLSRLGLAPVTLTHWQQVADRLVTGFDPATGLLEQFEGYFRLEPLPISGKEMLSRPLDAVAGRNRVQGSQLIKQADVVMLLALLRDQFPAEVIEQNFRYYEPRSNHGSSLSAPIHALVAARLGDIECAYAYFLRAAQTDLHNLMGNSRDGVHTGSLGGLWQALVFGFAGLDLGDGFLRLNPKLPAQWKQLQFTVTWHGQRLTISLSDAGQQVEITVDGKHSVPLALGSGAVQPLAPGQTYQASHTGTNWTPLTAVRRRSRRSTRTARVAP